MRSLLALSMVALLAASIPASATPAGPEGPTSAAHPGLAAGPSPSAAAPSPSAAAPSPSAAAPSPLALGTEAAGPLRPAAPLRAMQDFLLDPSPATAHLALAEQLEHQGVHPLGHTARMREVQAAAVAGALPPSFGYYDTYAFCDVSGDGVPDVIQNAYDFTTSRTTIRVLNGETGNFLWSAFRSYWIPYPFSYPPYHRDGEPMPEKINNPAVLPTFRAHNFAWTPDLNGDGVCDLITYEFFFRSVGAAIIIEIDIEALSGRNGQVLWLQEADAVYHAFSQAGLTEFAVVGFPTGFHVFESPSGPKFVWKTTDFQFAMYQDPLSLGIYAYQNTVSDRIEMRDGRDGEVLWARDLPYGEGDPRINVTYISGTADLAGDEEHEVILEQFMLPGADHLRPMLGLPGADEQTEPEYGRAFAVRTLRGELQGGGEDLWYRMIYDEELARAHPPTDEEGYESIQWTYAYPLGDTDGDGVSEIMAQMLTVESGDITSTNGQFRTRFVPLNGADGEMLWGEGAKFTGWGFAQRLQAGNTTQLIGIGTVDLPTPPPPGGRFPPKDVRMAAVWMADGTPAWTYHEQFPQDSFISYELALSQFMRALAPVDVNGDGFYDLLSPSQYIQPKAKEQVLLSTATQSFEVYDALTGDLLRRTEVYGSNGIAVRCNDGPDVTFIGGHATRLDATRVDLTTGKEAWRWVFYSDASPSSATAGSDLNWIGARCTDDEVNRTMLAGNIGIYSGKRGYEFRPYYGFIEGPDEDLLWFRASIDRELPLHLMLERLFAKEPLSSAESIARDATPIIPGVVLGTALGVVSKRQGWTFRRKGDGLPDLYGRGR